MSYNQPKKHIMDPIVTYYIEHTFSPEQMEDILSAFALLNTFVLPHFEQKYNDLLYNSENMSSSDVQDTFHSLVRKDVDDILKRHGIITFNYATLSQVIEIATSLAIIQNLENIEPVMITLESMEDDTTKLFRILSDFTTMDEVGLYAVIESIDPRMLDAIKTLCLSMESETTEVKNNAVHIELLKVLAEFTKNNKYTPMGIELVKTGFLPGYRFTNYLDTLKGSQVEKTYEEIAADVYSLLIISSDGIAAPVVIFKKYVEKMFDSYSVASEIERYLVTFIKNFQEFTEAYRAQNTLS